MSRARCENLLICIVGSIGEFISGLNAQAQYSLVKYATGYLIYFLESLSLGKIRVAGLLSKQIINSSFRAVSTKYILLIMHKSLLLISRK